MTGLFRMRPGRGPSRPGGASPSPAAHEPLEPRLLLAAVTPAAEQTVPSAPTSLRARPYGPDELRVSWADRSSDETGFRLRRRPPGGTFADLVTLPAGATFYVDPIDPAQFPRGTVFEYQVFAFNDAGPSSPANVASVVTGGAGGTGLRQRVWNDINDAAGREGVGVPAVDRVDPFVNHDWGEGSPAVGIDPDTFAVEWVGEIVAEETRNYTFSVVANDGVRLFINNTLVVAGGWKDQPETEYFADWLNLSAGQKVAVRLQAYDKTGPASVRLRWSGPGNVPEEIPSAFLFPTVAPSDEAAALPRRPATVVEAFALPPQLHSWSFTPAPVIGVRWQDNAFGEAGYEIQRATDPAFSQNVKMVSLSDDVFATNRQLVGPGRDLFIDDGGYNGETFVATPLDPNTEYYYRVRPLGAPDSAWVTAPHGVQPSHAQSGRDRALSRFPAGGANVTYNGDASPAPYGIKLTHNQPDRTASAFFNGAFDVDASFEASFQFQMYDSNGGGGMAFVIHNHRPAAPGATPLNAIGGGGDGLGYAGLPNSVAVTFDVSEDVDQIGLFVNGLVPGNGPATAVNDRAAWPLEYNNTIDLRLPSNGAIDLNNGTVYALRAVYSSDGQVLTLELRRADAGPDSIPLFATKFAIDIGVIVNPPLSAVPAEAVMGFTAANGPHVTGAHRIHAFAYDGPVRSWSGVLERVYVRGSSWAANPAVGDWLENNGHGHRTYGYRVDTLPSATSTVGTTIPWTNVNQVVLRYGYQVSDLELLRPRAFTLVGVRGEYDVRAVDRLGTDGTTILLTLDRALGVVPTPLAGADGDRVRLMIANGGPKGGTNVQLLLNSLQGDADHRNGRVNANDVGTVRSRQNRTAAETPPATVAPYSAFVDLDANGRINANDVGIVRSRANDVLPPLPVRAAASLVIPPALFSARRIRPGDRSAAAGLLR